MRAFVGTAQDTFICAQRHMQNKTAAFGLSKLPENARQEIEETLQTVARQQALYSDDVAELMRTAPSYDGNPKILRNLGAGADSTAFLVAGAPANAAPGHPSLYTLKVSPHMSDPRYGAILAGLEKDSLSKTMGDDMAKTFSHGVFPTPGGGKGHLSYGQIQEFLPGDVPKHTIPSKRKGVLSFLNTIERDMKSGLALTTNQDADLLRKKYEGVGIMDIRDDNVRLTAEGQPKVIDALDERVRHLGHLSVHNELGSAGGINKAPTSSRELAESYLKAVQNGGVTHPDDAVKGLSFLQRVRGGLTGPQRFLQKHVLRTPRFLALLSGLLATSTAAPYLYDAYKEGSCKTAAFRWPGENKKLDPVGTGVGFAAGTAGMIGGGSLINRALQRLAAQPRGLGWLMLAPLPAMGALMGGTLGSGGSLVDAHRRRQAEDEDEGYNFPETYTSLGALAGAIPGGLLMSLPGVPAPLKARGTPWLFGGALAGGAAGTALGIRDMVRDS